MTENAVEAVGLSKKFLLASERRESLKERFVRGRAPAPKTFWALRDASFSVPKGSSLGIIGHNGSGKSTALKVLTGIYRPTSGRVKVNGTVSALLEVGAGFHPELTGRENIRLNATILGFTNREIDRFMDQIIEFADIGEHIDAPLKHYSSGMHVRLGFAVAVLVRPEILIVDEVIAVGDEEFQRKCFDYLFDLRRRGTSMLIVSHGLGQITDLCDETVWLDHGRVRHQGPSREVVASYLASVNAAESARSAHGAQVAVPQGTRRGTGIVQILDVHARSLAEGGEGVLEQGEEAVIRMRYRAEVPVDGVSLTLTARNSEGIPVTVLTSNSLGPLLVPAEESYIEFRATPLLLAPGPYNLEPSFKGGGSVLDSIEGGFTVHVHSSRVDASGTYAQPGAWSDPVRLWPGGLLNDRPIVFVSGCPHSGTTLLATILGCAPGASLIPRETGWFTRGLSGAEIQSELNGLEGIPIEKTPNHVHHITTIRSGFPNARIVLITRDPMDTVASLAIRFRDLDRAIAEYNAYSAKVERAVVAGQASLVRLEDLVHDPERTLRALCPLLGLEFSAEMLEFHQHAPLWFGVTDPALLPDRDGTDHLRLRAWQVRQPLFDHSGKWREQLSPIEADRVRLLTSASAQWFGYQVRESGGIPWRN